MAAFYIDDYSYQENVLPRMHKLQGHQVGILASTETYLDNATLGYVAPRSYHTGDNIPISRVPYTRWLPHWLGKKLRIYEGISTALTTFNPEIIFLHDCQFISVREIAAYAQAHPAVVIYADSHTDFINSARGWVSRTVLHKLVYCWCVKTIEPFVQKFYGTLPLRVDFLRDVYGVPAGKIELLVFGADHTAVDLAAREETRQRIRSELDIGRQDLVLVTGGKIEPGKNIQVLMRAVAELRNANIKLIVFGKPNQAMQPEIEALAGSPSIRYLGWIPAEKAYGYFLAADVGFFPGTHSVLWEQAVGVGLPCVFKRWRGIQHVDLQGNCIFLEKADTAEITKCICALLEDEQLVARMKRVALAKGLTGFSYYEIAARAIASANQAKPAPGIAKTT